VIVVIADDFTGAAEIGGVALRYGLSVEVQSEFHPEVGADLLSIDADTRSCTAGEAARRAARVASLCREAGVERVFKKVDSALRGHVAAELGALMRAFDRPRAVLVPANPSLGRVIRDGHYFIAGRPLHETDFARDPEHPATTSDVVGLLDPAGAEPVRVQPPAGRLPARGIVVGEATTHADVVAWAGMLDDGTIPAGAAEFFGAFLEALGFPLGEGGSSERSHLGCGSALFVCGSISDYSRSFCRGCEARGVPVLRMPLGVLEGSPEAPRLVEEWAGAVVRALAGHAQVMVAIDRPLRHRSGLPQRLSGHLGTVVERVLARRAVDCIFVEGGATATALTRQLGWKRFAARAELAPGVVCMQVEGGRAPLLTLKPGSYAWPDEVLAGLGERGGITFQKRASAREDLIGDELTLHA